MKKVKQRNIRPTRAHGHANMSGFQCRCIIDSIPSHHYDLTICLERINDCQFLFWNNTRKDRYISNTFA